MLKQLKKGSNKLKLKEEKKKKQNQTFPLMFETSAPNLAGDKSVFRQHWAHCLNTFIGQSSWTVRNIFTLRLCRNKLFNLSRHLKMLQVVFSHEKYVEIEFADAVVHLCVFCHLIIVLCTYIALIFTYIAHKGCK